MAIQNRLPLRCLLRISGRLKQLLVRLSLWPCILTFMNPHGRQNARVPVTVILYHHVATPPTNAGWCRGILFGNTQHTHTHCRTNAWQIIVDSCGSGPNLEYSASLKESTEKAQKASMFQTFFTLSIVTGWKREVTDALSFLAWHYLGMSVVDPVFL